MWSGWRALSSSDLDASKFISVDKGNEVILMLSRYEEEMDKRGIVDLAGLYTLALEVLEADGHYMPDRYYLCLQDMASGWTGKAAAGKGCRRQVDACSSRAGLWMGEAEAIV